MCYQVNSCNVVVAYLQRAWVCSKLGSIASQVIMDFDNGCQTRSFFSNRGSKRATVFTYDGSITFEEHEISSICQGWKYQVG